MIVRTAIKLKTFLSKKEEQCISNEILEQVSISGSEGSQMQLCYFFLFFFL